MSRTQKDPASRLDMDLLVVEMQIEAPFVHHNKLIVLLHPRATGAPGRVQDVSYYSCAAPHPEVF